MSKKREKEFILPSSSVYSSEEKGRVKANKSIRYILFTFVALILGIGLSILLFFNIEQIEVVGTEKYTAQEIIDVSGIKTGENFLLTDIDRNADKITRLLPYIEKCSMSRKLPGKVIINVTEEACICSVKTDEGYAVLGSKAKVLEHLSTRPESLAVITGADILDAQSGSQLLCESEDELIVFTELLSGLYEAQLEDVEIIDITDNFNINLYVDDRFRIDIGSSADVSSKLKRVKEVISKLEPTDIGILDVTVEGRVSFLPVRQGDTIYKNGADML